MNSFPTLASEVNYQTQDGVTISADWYKQEKPISPVVVLVHMLGEDRSSWGDLPIKLKEQGFSVLNIDLRGHGKSIRQNGQILNYRNFTIEDWPKIDFEMHAALDFLGTKPINREKIYFVGASIGANASMIIGAEVTLIPAIVLLSPGEDYRDIKTFPAAKEYEGRSALILASSEDTQSFSASQKIAELIGPSATFIAESGVGHGTNMLIAKPSLKETIIDYLLAN